MRKQSRGSDYPEHFLEENSAEEVASRVSESDQDSNFETSSRDDFSSHDQPL